MENKEKLLLAIPPEKWGYRNLSLKVRWETLEKMIEKNPRLKRLLDWKQISNNESVTADIIINNFNKYPWDIKTLTPKLIRSDFTILFSECIHSLDWDFISSKREYSDAFIETNKNLSLLNWGKLSLLYDLDFVFQRRDLPWKMEIVCKNLKNFKVKWWDYIRSEPNLPWDWKVISHLNFKIPTDILVLGIRANNIIDYQHLSFENRVDLEVVEQFPDKDWNWEGLSCHKFLDQELVLKFQDKNWNYGIILTRDF